MNDHQLSLDFATGAPRYPYGPGHRGVDTSIEAAKAVAPTCKIMREKIVQILKLRGTRGATTRELVKLTGWEYGTVQPRTSELKRDGRIAHSGRRRKVPGKNHTETIWVVV